MNLININIAIIERSPLGSSAIATVLKEADFNIVIKTNTAHFFLEKAKEKSMDPPDICLFDTTMKDLFVRKIRQHYPKIKIIVYDPIINLPDAEELHHNNFDAYIPNSVKLEHWAQTLQSILAL